MDFILKVINIIFSAYGGATAVLIALTSTIGTIWINRIREEDRKKVEVYLKSFQNDLDKIKLEHQVQYTNVYQKQADLIAQLYSKISYLEKHLEKFRTQQTPELWDEVSNSIRDVIDFFDSNLIYFDPILCKIIDETIKQYQIARFSLRNLDIIGMKVFALIHENKDTSNLEKDIEALGAQITEALDKKLPALKTELINQFRKIIGIKIE